MKTPTIRSQNILLRPFAKADLTDRYVAWLNDPLVTQFSELRHTRHTRESCAAYLEAIEKAGHFFWAIELHIEAPEHIGNITAYIDHQNGIADVAILLGQATARGRGYGTAAFGSACQWLLASGFRKVTAGTVRPNVAMLAIMRRIGMLEDGVRPNHYVIAGAEADVIYGALFSPRRS